MRTRLTLGIQFVMRINRNKTDGLIYARLTVEGNRIEISLKKTICTDNWNSAKGMAKGSSLEMKSFNNFLNQVRVRLTEIFHELQIKNQEITAEKIKSLFLGEDQEEHTLCELIEYHNVSQHGILKYGTLKNYYTTKRYIEKFLMSKFKTKDTKLSQLNYKFVIEFEYFLRHYKPLDHHQPIGNNGLMKHQQRLKKILSLGIRMDWLKHNPYDLYELKFKKSERGFLDAQELAAIENKNFKIERLQLIKDLFVFSCYTGLAYIDAINLKKSELALGVDGQLWIYTTREKTDVQVKVPLLPIAYEIIEKYKTNPRSINRGCIFPLISNQKLNSYLKEIADLCGITKNISFHLARHTFATTVTLTNGVPIETVSSMLGHKSITTTQIYAKVVEQKVSQDMAVLRNKLSGFATKMEKPLLMS
ncbi:MAG TPA: site-specific integrase [Prolixibacteraceae bacterium]|nr:site-specific integrase [Prolixibacteraceae bacterium]